MLKKVVNFLFELGHLARTPRSGYLRLGLDRVQNVAEHTARGAQLAFVIAIMEGHKNPCHCATLMVFHDITEIRTWDHCAVSKHYNRTNHEEALSDQIQGTQKVSEGVRLVWEEFENKFTKASKIANDADVLEMHLRARELMSLGVADAELWITNSIDRLYTESAKQLAEEIKNADPNEWWKSLSKRKQFADGVGL